MKIKQHLMTLAILGTSFVAISKNNEGIYSSNYDGVIDIYINPTSFVDGRFKVDISIGIFNVNTCQNAFKFVFTLKKD